MKKRWKPGVWGILFILVLLIWGLASTYYYAAQLHEYYRLETVAVAVKATVTKKEDTLDANDSSAYKLYITYSYDGVTYTDVYYKESSKSSLYGKTVTVEIDPENPGKLRPVSLRALMTYTVVSAAIPVFALLLAFSYAKHAGTCIARDSWMEFYRSPILSPESVQRDVDAGSTPARKSAVWILSIFAAVVLAASVRFYLAYRSFTVVPFYGIALAAAVWFFWNCAGPVADLRIRQVILQSVEVRHDSEHDTDEVIWHFDAADRKPTDGFAWHFDAAKWKPDDSIFVTRTARSLSSCQPGDKFYIAQTAGHGKKHEIVRLYDAREFRLL